VSFFGIEIEILEINGQRAANFKPVVQPNNWVGARSLPPGGGGPPSARLLASQAYFTELLEELKRRAPGITTASRAQPQNWFGFASGRAGATFNWVYARDMLRVELYIDTDERPVNLAIFETLYRDRESIEQVIGTPLEWGRLEERRAKRVAVYAPSAVALAGPEDQLQRQKDWAVETMIKFVKAFRPRLKAMAPVADVVV